MTRRTFSRTKRRNEGRWLLAGLLMATTALVMIPEAEAQSGIRYVTSPDPLDPRDVRFDAISGNGNYVAGSLVHSASGLFRATRWDATGAELDLGSDPGASSFVTGMSYDGRVVVGSSGFWNMPGAFRWTEDGGLEYLGSFGGTQSYAMDVSHDGNVVVGQARRADFRDVGFVWIKDATTGAAGNPQMHELPAALVGMTNIGVMGISGDGRYAITRETNAVSAWQAYRHDISGIQTGTTSHVALGHLGGSQTSPEDISTDGSVVVGYSSIDAAAGSYYRAFRWVEGATGGIASNPEMYQLGTLGGNSSWATAVSGDGSVLVGRATDVDEVVHAFRWDEVSGLLSVADWLRAAGVDVARPLVDATDVTDDGNVVVGTMWDADGNRVGYIARVAPGPGPNPGPGPQPGTGLMNVSEYHQTLYAGAGGIASAGEFLSWLPMNGAHHRPLMLTPELDGDMCAWATGDFAHHGGTSMGIGLAEVGACTDLAGGAVRIGGAVGTTRSWQDLALGGSSRMAGQYVLGEVDWQPDGTPLLLSVTGMLGGWQANVDRAYSNGADTAISSGQTNAMGGVVRLRADWLDAATLGNTTINPWTSVSVGALHVDGYAESGGPFPARFNAQDLSHVDVRLGLTAITEISTQTKLSTTFEVAHRTGSAPTASGQVDGLFAFSLGGGQQSNTWLRVGAELDHKINESLSLSGSVHFATAGRDPSVAGSIGLKGAF